MEATKFPAPLDPAVTQSDADSHLGSAIPDQVVIAFVEELDRAQQHFDFTQDLFKLIPPEAVPEDLDHIAFTLATVNQQHAVFPLLGVSDIYNLVKPYLVEMNVCQEKASIRDSLKRKQPYRCPNAVFSLLSRVRLQGYVLDKNPRKELEKLQKFAPVSYGSLACREPPVDKMDRTVLVSNLSDAVSGEDICYLFRPCGRIEWLEIKSEYPGQVIAEITFEELDSAKYASTLMFQKGREMMLKDEDRPLSVKFQLNSDTSVVEKAEDVRCLYKVAMERYRDIWMRYSEVPGKRKDCAATNGKDYWDPAEVKDECWNFYEWMQIEALSNGGFTVEGDSLRRP